MSLRVSSTMLVVSFLVFMPIGSTLSSTPLSANVSSTMNAPWNFLGQNQQNTWYSPQTIINTSSVASLKLKWATALPNIASTPITSGRIVYVAGGTWGPINNELTGSIYALNESTGAIIWEDGSSAQTGLGFSDVTGIALDNGNVFADTTANTLVSLNALTGAINWQTSILQGLAGENPNAVFVGGQGTPLVWNGEVITSDVSSNVYGRGFVRAFSESTGAPMWVFYTTPPNPITSSDQSAYGNSWGACTMCGGGDNWNVPAIDTHKGIIYFGTGDSFPYFNASQRAPVAGNTDLYTDCVIALNAVTGQMIWYHKETPVDVHDWDSGMPVQLFNTTINGAQTEVVGSGTKSGLYYLLNAHSGSLIYSVSLGIHQNTNQAPTPGGEITYPGSDGGVNTYYTYDPTTNMIYVMAWNHPDYFYSAPISSDIVAGSDAAVSGVSDNSTLYAIDASTGTVAWKMNTSGLSGGASSSNDLVFTADTNGNYYALNGETGSILWEWSSGKGGALANFGPASVADGMLFETSYLSNGGVYAFSLASSTIGGGTSQLTVVSANTTGSAITGYYTVLNYGGSVVATAFTPATFTVNNGQTYSVGVDDYQSCHFDHWLDTGSTTRERTIAIDTNTRLTAVMNCGTGSSQSSLTINSADQNGNAINGYYTELFQGSSIAGTGFTPATFQTTSGQSYSIQVDNYGSCSFDHWQDTGSKDDPRAITAAGSTQSFTAVYDCGVTTGGSTSITVQSVDQSSNPITGYYTVLLQNGNNIGTGFTPVIFSSLKMGQTYDVQVYDYGSCTFVHWSDAPSDTANPRQVTATSNPQTFTAVYGCGVSTTSTIRVSTVTSSGGTLSGYYITLWQTGVQIESCYSTCSFSVNSGQTYQVAAASYGSETFDHWQNDGSTGFETVSVRSTGITISLTAVYSP